MDIKLKGSIYDNYNKHLSNYEDVSIKGLERWKNYYHINYNRFLPSDKNAKILDIGCGHGRLLYYLKSRGYHNIHGIDISSQQIKAAIQNGFDSVECASAFDFLNNKREEYDAIIMIDILEHIEKSEELQLLNKVHNALKINGRVILQLPNALSLFNEFLYQDITHETAFTSGSARQILDIAGFKNINIYSVMPPSHGLKRLVASLMWWLFWQNLIRFYMLSVNGNLMGDVYTGNLMAIAEKR
ncbi:MAG: hypothetical protein A2539_10400 [Elusimicrobia bacterium RIFOXYD2_FULL_34_15]|nr:MAG: hypothetical protein A2539_10400 [Elusimicrobia bacterium RIFOXYD2_FULL_34_15]